MFIFNICSNIQLFNINSFFLFPKRSKTKGVSRLNEHIQTWLCAKFERRQPWLDTFTDEKSTPIGSVRLHETLNVLHSFNYFDSEFFGVFAVLRKFKKVNDKNTFNIFLKFKNIKNQK